MRDDRGRGGQRDPRGRLLARGGIPELQQRLGLGDHVRLVFQDSPAPLDYGRLPGVLAHRVSDRGVELRVDGAETRVRPILEAVAQAARRVAEVHLKGVDLEEIYHEITH